jgi:hypothetical protein
MLSRWAFAPVDVSIMHTSRARTNLFIDKYACIFGKVS